jgi:DNA processing protein
MVLSELPPGSLPWRWTFRAQSRITAGLASATVVVEAVECSGSLATANYAEMIGREVGAVPGEVTSRVSAGPNSLLAAGASVIRDAQDVVQILRH